MRSSRYTIIFACVMSMLLSVILSGVYMVLKERQDDNRALEQQLSILSAAHISSSSPEDAKRIYSERVKVLVINRLGQTVENADPKTVDNKNLSILYAIKSSESSAISSYVYPVVGAGLWSKLFGYLAVDASGKNVVGLVFYKQGETPGLGAEIDQPWFTKNFEGKTLFDGEKLVGIKVTKGPSERDPEYKYASNRMVDGISGASITCNGVSAMLAKEPSRYEAFFKRVTAEMINDQH